MDLKFRVKYPHIRSDHYFGPRRHEPSLRVVLRRWLTNGQIFHENG